MEMRWLKEHGLISSLADYEDLPVGVLEDARAVMEAEVIEHQRREQHGIRR